MKKKKFSLLVILPLVVVLAACSSLNLTGAGSSAAGQNQQSQQTQGQSQNPATQPIESKLAVGTLKLEGTSNAVTADQAKTLLPLWKAMKALGSSQTAAGDEMTALYTQIQESMTAQQVQAIKDMSLKPEDTQALMKQYNVQIQMPEGMPTMSPAQQATMQARRSSGNNSGGAGGPGGPGGGFVGGAPPDGGGPGGFAGGQPPDGFTAGQGRQSNNQSGVQRTPVPGQQNRGFGGGFNQIWLDPLIKLLEQRAG